MIHDNRYYVVPCGYVLQSDFGKMAELRCLEIYDSVRVHNVRDTAKEIERKFFERLHLEFTRDHPKYEGVKNLRTLYNFLSSLPPATRDLLGITDNTDYHKVEEELKDLKRLQSILTKTGNKELGRLLDFLRERVKPFCVVNVLTNNTHLLKSGHPSLN